MSGMKPGIFLENSEKQEWIYTPQSSGELSYGAGSGPIWPLGAHPRPHSAAPKHSSQMHDMKDELSLEFCIISSFK